MVKLYGPFFERPPSISLISKCVQSYNHSAVYICILEKVDGETGVHGLPVRMTLHLVAEFVCMVNVRAYEKLTLACDLYLNRTCVALPNRTHEQRVYAEPSNVSTTVYIEHEQTRTRNMKLHM